MSQTVFKVRLIKSAAISKQSEKQTYDSLKDCK